MNTEHELDSIKQHVIPQMNVELATLRAKLATAEQQHKRAVELLRELLGSVTAKAAPDTTQPIMWSGSPYQNRRLFAAIEIVRAHVAANKETSP